MDTPNNKMSDVPLNEDTPGSVEVTPPSDASASAAAVDEVDDTVPDPSEEEKVQMMIDHCADLQSLVISIRGDIDDPVGSGPKNAVRIGKMLAKNNSLFDVNMSGCFIGDEGLASIADGLMTNKSVHALRIDGDHTIGEAGMKALAEMIKVNVTLGCVALTGCSVGASGARDLGAALAENSRLQVLILNDTDIGGDGAAGLAKGFWEGSGLTMVFLQNCGIGPLVAGVLVKEAMKVKTLETLCLSGNPDLCNMGAATIAASLKSPESKLATLLLKGCGIGGEGASELGRALRTNVSLKWLDISNCPIGNSAIAVLADALKENTVLERLTLNATRTDDMGADFLSRMLNTNTTLKQLDIRNCRIGITGLNYIAAAMEKNTTLVVLGLDLEYMGVDPDLINGFMRRNRDFAVDGKQARP